MNLRAPATISIPSVNERPEHEREGEGETHSPTAAPLAAAGVSGIKHAKTSTMLKHWPTVPHKNSFRLPTRSMMNQDTVAKMA